MNWGPEAWDAWTRESARLEEPVLPAETATLLGMLDGLDGREGMTVADLGCGRGALLTFLAARFRQVVAVDYAPASLAVARRACRDRRVIFRRRDLRDLTPFRKSLHVAVAVESILGPRPADVDRMLGEIHAALLEGGLLFATVPAHARNDRPVALPLGAESRFEGELRFTQADLQYRFRKAGFAGVRLQRFPASVARPAMWLATAVRRGNN